MQAYPGPRGEREEIEARNSGGTRVSLFGIIRPRRFLFVLALNWM